MRAASLIAALCLVVLGAAGCEAINDATAPIDRSKLIEDMTQQLDEGREVLHQAEYQLAGGYRGSVAQQVMPARTVYGYPGGMLIVNGTEQTLCDTNARPAKCQLRNIAAASAGLPTSYTEPTKHGLITGPVVADLLRVASLQPAAVVKPHDSTIAGQQASCLDISGLVDAPSALFTVCVTAEGVLASFSGVVDGLNVDQALIQVNRRVPDEAFALPVGAVVADLRQRASPASIG